MSFRPVSVMLVLAGAMTMGTGCPEDDGLAEIPRVMEIGDPFNDEATICDEEDRISDCAYAFGDVNVGEGRFLKIQIENPAIDAELVIESIAIDQTRGDSGVFSVEGEMTFPITLPKATLDGPVDPLLVSVRYVPLVAGQDQTAYLMVESDAENVLDENGDQVPLEIVLTGNAVDNARPEVVVEPAECDFGEVGLAATAFCDISVKNVGARDLQITGVDFADSATFPSVFNAETIVAIPTFVAPGTATSIRFSASPSSPQVLRNDFILSSNDPLNPQVTVPLKVLGAEAPTAVARILSINNVANNQATPDIRPLDDVILTGTDSVPAQANGTIVAHHWTILSKPMESTVQLSTPDGVNTGFRFNSAQGIVSGLDVAGEYVIGLVVDDDTPLTSTNDARVVLNAVPSEALHIELTWESPNWDLDLHMTKDGGGYCQPESCYYANCKPGAVGYPEWDGTGGRGGGDPVLDIDDLDGYGPENINIDDPTEGVYRAAVHTFSAGLNEDVGVTLKVYVNGALAYDDYRIMNDGGDMWEVVEISWANGVPTVFPVNLYDGAGAGCQSF